MLKRWVMTEGTQDYFLRTKDLKQKEDHTKDSCPQLALFLNAILHGIPNS